MDWKYKHFRQERFFPAERDLVAEAARAFMAESLRWQVTNTPAGFTAEGHSFSHGAIANLQIQSAVGGKSAEPGTKVAIELLVRRAGPFGFILFDVGGYYTIQVSKWLDCIQWSLDQKFGGSSDQSANPLVVAANKPAAHLFNGCLVFICVMFAVYFLATFIGAIVGLFSG